PSRRLRTCSITSARSSSAGSRTIGDSSSPCSTRKERSRPAIHGFRWTASRRPSPSRGRTDGSRRKGSSFARTQVFTPPVLQVPRRRLARRRPVPDAHGRLARLDLQLRRLRRRALQPLLLAGDPLRPAESAVPLQDLRAGRGLSGWLLDLGRMVLLCDRHRVPPALLRMQLSERMLIAGLPLLHTAQHPLHAEAALGRPAVPMPAGGGSRPRRCAWLA